MKTVAFEFLPEQGSRPIKVKLPGAFPIFESAEMCPQAWPETQTKIREAFAALKGEPLSNEECACLEAQMSPGLWMLVEGKLAELWDLLPLDHSALTFGDGLQIFLGVLQTTQPDSTESLIAILEGTKVRLCASDLPLKPQASRHAAGRWGS